RRTDHPDGQRARRSPCRGDCCLSARTRLSGLGNSQRPPGYRGPMSDLVLVTGGAGYIGSHTVYALLDRGDRVVVLDDLSTGVKAQIGKDAVFVQGDVADTQLVKQIVAEHNVQSVIHFAGAIVVPDSVRDPLSYYDT